MDDAPSSSLGKEEPVTGGPTDTPTVTEDHKSSDDGGGGLHNSVGGLEALAESISLTAGAAFRDFDAKAESATRSQDVLSLSLDRLTAQLDGLLEGAPLPVIMQHAAKIHGIRKRVQALNSLLNSIQRRLDHMDRLVAVGPPQEFSASKKASEPSSSASQM